MVVGAVFAAVVAECVVVAVTGAMVVLCVVVAVTGAAVVGCVGGGGTVNVVTPEFCSCDAGAGNMFRPLIVMLMCTLRSIVT